MSTTALKALTATTEIALIVGTLLLNLLVMLLSSSVVLLTLTPARMIRTIAMSLRKMFIRKKQTV